MTLRTSTCLGLFILLIINTTVVLALTADQHNNQIQQRIEQERENIIQQKELEEIEKIKKSYSLEDEEQEEEVKEYN